jgi:2'-5' RNA ligase
MGDWRDIVRPGTLLIWPPEPLRTRVNTLRRTYNPEAQKNCDGHITLTQRFLIPPNKAAFQTIEAIAATTSAFSIHFGPIERFGTSVVVKFDIGPKPIILALRERLHATGLFNLRLPFTEGFIPHMTVSEFGLKTPKAAAKVVQKLNETVEMGTFPCVEFAYARPDGFSHFHTVRTFPLRTP